MLVQSNCHNCHEAIQVLCVKPSIWFKANCW
jgi:hypothetical protein